VCVAGTIMIQHTSTILLFRLSPFIHWKYLPEKMLMQVLNIDQLIDYYKDICQRRANRCFSQQEISTFGTVCGIVGDRKKMIRQ